MRDSATSLVKLVWLDVARLLAMAMVAIQHGLTVIDITPPRLFFNLDAGQIGVAMFFSISGFLVVQDRASSTGPWLMRRLRRIFIPYWITVTALLAANYLLSYKPASVSLVVSEYMGLAGWTHRGELIGVHLWFVSLLLFCYALGAIARTFPRSLPFIVAATIAWLWSDPFYAGHTLAFLTGVSFGRFGRKPPIVGLVAASIAAIALALSVRVGFACIAVGATTLTSTAIPIQVSAQIARLHSKASELSYHFYLVHGPIFLLVARAFSGSLMAVAVVGTVGSVVAAILLHGMDAALQRSLSAVHCSPWRAKSTSATEDLS